MNWEALGAIGEIVGAVAVVVTLGYLAVQTRQNTRAVRVASFHQIVDSFSAVSLAIVQDATLSSLLMRSIVDPRSLTAEDYSRYGFFLLTFLRRAKSMFFHSEQGTLQRDSWHGIRVSLEEILATEPAQRWWSLNAHRFNPTFRDYVAAELLAKEEAAGGAISSILRP